jgi:hypothetical protein
MRIVLRLSISGTHAYNWVTTLYRPSHQYMFLPSLAITDTLQKLNDSAGPRGLCSLLNVSSVSK